MKMRPEGRLGAHQCIWTCQVENRSQGEGESGRAGVKEGKRGGVSGVQSPGDDKQVN